MGVVIYLKTETSIKTANVVEESWNVVGSSQPEIAFVELHLDISR